MTTGPTWIGRRRFLGAGLVAAAGGPLLGTGSRHGRRAARARNVILMVADGMSTGTFSLAEAARRVRGQGHGAWVRCWARPDARRAMMETSSADSFVTDSGAASTAWSTGVKVNNGAICVAPDGRELEPILRVAQRAGLATGLVTTTRVTHATPAGFIANVPSRDREDEIARQIMSRGVDVVLGGGAKHFHDETLGLRSGVTVARDRRSLLEAVGRTPLLGLFSASHMSYEIDRPETEPTLADMSGAAIRSLLTRDRGFMLQIEGGRVDHAAHANDAATLVREQLAFDDAIDTVLGLVGDRGDTLVLITSDHGNGNPGLTVYGPDAERGIERLLSAGHSFEWLLERAQTNNPNAGSRVRSLIAEMSGIELDDAGIDTFLRAASGQKMDPFVPRQAVVSVLGSLLGNQYGVGWVSPNHTSDMVELTAVGPGAQALPTWVDNTQLRGFMLSAVGVAV